MRISWPVTRCRRLLAELLLQLNPAFRRGGTVDDLVEQGVLAEERSRIFRIRESSADHHGSQLPLHRFQHEAILAQV